MNQGNNSALDKLIEQGVSPKWARATVDQRITAQEIFGGQPERRAPYTPPPSPKAKPHAPKTASATEEAIAQAESVTITATGADILDWIVGFLLRFVSLTKEQAIASALWVVHTHAIDAADCTAYLAINSAEKQSGKTRQLEVMKLLVREPWFTGRVSAAVLVRKIDAKQPSLLLDESDAAFGGDETYTEALRGILNSGYRRGGCASLCVGQGAAMTYNDFKTFSCKAIAGLNRLPDTIVDRSIPIRLKRAPRGTVERFRERDAEQEAKPQKAQIAAWCKTHVEELRNARPDIPSGLSDRQADVCEPLLAIADAVGGEWPKTARMALVKLCVGAQADDGSTGVRLLRDIKTIFTDKRANEISSADLCEALALVETSPWGEWSKGKPLSPAKLARLLTPFEIPRIRPGAALGGAPPTSKNACLPCWSTRNSDHSRMPQFAADQPHIVAVLVDTRALGQLNS
jgi:hypothetical protein